MFGSQGFNFICFARDPKRVGKNLADAVRTLLGKRDPNDIENLTQEERDLIRVGNNVVKEIDIVRKVFGHFWENKFSSATEEILSIKMTVSVIAMP